MKLNIEKLKEIKFFKSSFFLSIVLIVFIIVSACSSLFLLPGLLNGHLVMPNTLIGDFLLVPLLIISTVFLCGILPPLWFSGFYYEIYKEKLSKPQIFLITVDCLIIAFAFLIILTHSRHYYEYLLTMLVVLLPGVLIYGLLLLGNIIGKKIFNYIKNSVPLSIKLFLAISISIFLLGILFVLPKISSLYFAFKLMCFIAIFIIILIILIYTWFSKNTISKLSASLVAFLCFINIFISHVQGYYQSHYYMINNYKHNLEVNFNTVIFIYIFIQFLIITTFLILTTNRATIKYIKADSKKVNIKKSLILSGLILFFISVIILTSKFQLEMNYAVAFLIPLSLCAPGTLIKFLYEAEKV